MAKERLAEKELAHSSTGDVAAFVASILWASLTVFSRYLLASGTDSISIVGLRAVLATIMLGVVLVVRRVSLRIRSMADLSMFLAFGLAVAANYASYISAIKHGSVITAVTLLYTYPAVAVVLGALFLNEKISSKTLCALALTLAGAAMVSGLVGKAPDNTSLLGVVFGLSTSLAMATYAILGKVISKKYNSWVTVFYGFLFGAVVLLTARGPINAVLEVINWPLRNWAALFGMALFPTLLAYGIFTYSLNFIGAGRASMIGMSEPVLGAILGCALYNEPLSFWQVAGGVLVLCGVGVLVRKSD